MPRVAFCDNRFQLDHPGLIDPRQNETWTEIDRQRLPQAIAAGFETPLDFPPIAQAVVPGDSIAIAVEPETPCGAEVASLVAQRFVDTGIDRDNISIVLASSSDSNDTVRAVVHDADNEEQLAWLAADRNGVPFSVNRILFDADLVVPIGTGDCGSRHNRLCPAFCDRQTREFVEGLDLEEARAVSRMIDNNLGVFWQVRIVTGPGESVLQVHVGQSESVLEAAGKSGREAWTLQVAADAEMVLATIESSCGQSWDNLRKAILNADKVTRHSAPMVICTSLAGKPPGYWPTPDNQSKRMDATLADVIRSRHVYLASQLSQTATETYGFGFLESADQIERLIEQTGSCLILRDAHLLSLDIVEKVNSDG